MELYTPISWGWSDVHQQEMCLEKAPICGLDLHSALKYAEKAYGADTAAAQNDRTAEIVFYGTHS